MGPGTPVPVRGVEKPSGVARRPEGRTLAFDDGDRQALAGQVVGCRATRNAGADHDYHCVPICGWNRRWMERETGFEPATSSLARKCSTTELLPQRSLPMTAGAPECRGPESNWRHQHFQCCALPTELPRRHSILRSGLSQCQGRRRRKAPPVSPPRGCFRAALRLDGAHTVL